MASPEYFPSLEPWTFRPPSADSWISEAFVRDTDTLTKALQKSLSSPSGDLNPAEATVSPFFNLVKPDTTAEVTQTQSCSGSELETAASKRRSGIPVSGKPTKLKSRASKRATTTFITVDPANFRQMVQEVTGVRFGRNAQLPVYSVVKREPQRPVNRMEGCLPTLDTSAFLLDHQQPVVGPTTALVAEEAVHPSLVMASPALGGDCGGGFGYFESFSSFPTLESWKVM